MLIAGDTPDLELCRRLDAEGITLPSSWEKKGERSFEQAYMDAATRKKIWVLFGKVRGDLRKWGLLQVIP